MTPRLYVGYALVIAAFALILMLGYGVIEPFGSFEHATDLQGVLLAAAPSLLVPLLLFAVGLWLVKGARRK